jgi:hygromycin-B 4-O-kinase
MTSKNPSPASKVNKFKELARRVVEHHFGSRPGRIAFKTGGLSNFVFGVKHREGDFVVRISPDAAAVNSFIKEQWTQQAAHKAGVPTAEILEVGSSVIPHPYMITRTVDGDDASSHPMRLEILREMGRLAARIHSVPTKGFGTTFDWSNNLLSRNESWKEYLEVEYNFEGKLEILARHGVADTGKIKSLRKTFRDAVGLRAKPVLNHGDLRLKNVLADKNGKITALIDWEKATSHLAPHWELSLALHDLGIDEKQHFIEGYGIKPKKLSEAAPLVKAFNMLNYIPEVDRAVREKDKARLDHIRARFAGIYDLYSVA